MMERESKLHVQRERHPQDTLKYANISYYDITYGIIYHKRFARVRTYCWQVVLRELIGTFTESKLESVVFHILYTRYPCYHSPDSPQRWHISIEPHIHKKLEVFE